MRNSKYNSGDTYEELIAERSGLQESESDRVASISKDQIRDILSFKDSVIPLMNMSPEEIGETLDLRYIVYTKQRKWEQENLFGMEYDEYDYAPNTYYVGIKDANTGKMIASSRIIKKQKDTTLPIETLGNFDPNFLPENEEIAEISRWCTHPDYQGKQHGLLMPSLAMMSLQKVVCSAGVSTVFVVMEPRLAKLLSRYVGLNFSQLSKSIEYHGEKRAIFSITPEKAREAINNPMTESLVEAFQNEITELQDLTINKRKEYINNIYFSLKEDFGSYRIDMTPYFKGSSIYLVIGDEQYQRYHQDTLEEKELKHLKDGNSITVYEQHRDGTLSVPVILVYENGNYWMWYKYVV